MPRTSSLMNSLTRGKVKVSKIMRNAKRYNLSAVAITDKLNELTHKLSNTGIKTTTFKVSTCDLTKSLRKLKATSDEHIDPVLLNRLAALSLDDLSDSKDDVSLEESVPQLDVDADDCMDVDDVDIAMVSPVIGWEKSNSNEPMDVDNNEYEALDAIITSPAVKPVFVSASSVTSANYVPPPGLHFALGPSLLPNDTEEPMTWSPFPPCPFAFASVPQEDLGAEFDRAFEPSTSSRCTLLSTSALLFSPEADEHGLPSPVVVFQGPLRLPANDLSDEFRESSIGFNLAYTSRPEVSGSSYSPRTSFSRMENTSLASWFEPTVPALVAPTIATLVQPQAFLPILSQLDDLPDFVEDEEVAQTETVQELNAESEVPMTPPSAPEDVVNAFLITVTDEINYRTPGSLFDILLAS